MSHYNPDELHITKEQLMSKLELILRRWDKDPNISAMVKKRFRLDLFFMRHFLKDEHLPLYWKNFLELFDELRSYNARKGEKTLEKLNPLHEKALDQKLTYVPPVSELDAHNIMAKLRLQMKYPGLSDD